MTIEKVSNCRTPNQWLHLIGKLFAMAENPSRVKNSLRSRSENLSLNKTL